MSSQGLGPCVHIVLMNSYKGLGPWMAMDVHCSCEHRVWGHGYYFPIWIHKVWDSAISQMNSKGLGPWLLIMLIINFHHECIGLGTTRGIRPSLCPEPISLPCMTWTLSPLILTWRPPLNSWNPFIIWTSLYYPASFPCLCSFTFPYLPPWPYNDICPRAPLTCQNIWLAT